MIFCLCLSLCLAGILKTWRRNFYDFFLRRLGRMTANSLFDFGGDPGYDVATGICQTIFTRAVYRRCILLKACSVAWATVWVLQLLLVYNKMHSINTVTFVTFNALQYIHYEIVRTLHRESEWVGFNVCINTFRSFQSMRPPTDISTIILYYILDTSFRVVFSSRITFKITHGFTRGSKFQITFRRNRDITNSEPRAWVVDFHDLHS